MSNQIINLKHHYRQFDGSFFCWPELSAADAALPQNLCFKLPDGKEVQAVLQAVLMDFGRSGRTGVEVIRNTAYAEILAEAFAVGGQKTAAENFQDELIKHISGYFSSGDDLFADFATGGADTDTLKILLLRRVDQ